MKAEEVHINSKVMELRSEISQRKKILAHAGTRLRKALPNKVQLNGMAYTTIQSDSGLEPPTHLQECMAGYSVKKHELELLIQQNKRKMLT